MARAGRSGCVGVSPSSASPAADGGSSSAAASASPVKKTMYALAENDEFDRDEIATYEEVARLVPYSAFPRPIVLVGPPGVGRNELKRRLIELDPDKFRTTIPCPYHYITLPLGRFTKLSKG